MLAHNEERDKHLRKFLRERIQKIVKRSCESSIVLRDNFFRIPDHLKELSSEVFRVQLLQILKQHRNQDCPDKYSNAILELVLSKQMCWTEKSYIELLDIISSYTDLNMLTSFNKLLDFWTKSFNDKRDENFPRICKQWYIKLLDRGSTFASKRDKFVFLALNHVSMVHEYIGELNVWNDLLEMAINRIKNWPSNSIFEITDKVEKRLVPRVRKAFLSMMKEILKPVEINDQLMNIIKRICTRYTESGEDDILISSSEIYVPGR